MPRPNQDSEVSDTVTRCHRRVFRQIHPTQLKRIHEEWNAKKPILRTWSMAARRFLSSPDRCLLPLWRSAQPASGLILQDDQVDVGRLRISAVLKTLELMNEESFDGPFDALLCDSTGQKIPEHVDPRSIQIAE
jgi:hypothetical protein